MIEEFRQPMIDRFVLLLFNKHMIGKYDFEFPDEGGVVLNEDGFRKFCTEYEKWVKRNSFRNRMREQAAQLKKAICKGEEYTPYSWERENVHC